MIFCLNQDFNKNYKMNRINLTNPENLVKIPVQTKKQISSPPLTTPQNIGY